MKRVITKGTAQREVDTVLVKFEDDNIGKKAKTTSQYTAENPGAVPIKRYGAVFQYRKKVSIFRQQFPLALSWASTIHSVQ